MRVPEAFVGRLDHPWLTRWQPFVTSPWFIFLLGLSLGFASTLRVVPVIAVLGLAFLLCNIRNLDLPVAPLVALGLFVLFYFLYWLGYQEPVLPPGSDGMTLQLWARRLSVAPAAVLVFLVVYSLHDGRLVKLLLLGMAAGMLCYAALFMFYTMLNQSPPYRGLLLSPFSGERVNSPGISNLASFYAFTFIGMWLLASLRWNGWLLLLGLAALVVSLFIGVMLGGRAYFVAMALAVMVCILSRLFHPRVLLVTALIVAAGVLLHLLVASLFPVYDQIAQSTLNRFANQGFESRRFDHYLSWWSQFTAAPFERAVVDQSIERTYWFHNVLMDVHRTSGFLPMLVLAMTLIWAGVAIIIRAFSDFTGAALLAGLFLATLFMMFTSIPIEAERAIMIYFAALLAVTSQSGNPEFDHAG